jgi:oxygen-independent coproporphyrinogen-3 oxidase
MTKVNANDYIRSVEAGELPLGSATSFGARAMESRSIKMALSTCRPIRDDIHRLRFAGQSIFDEPWSSTFADLTRRGLTKVDREAGTVALTHTGTTLVEAIMNTEF